MPESAVYVGRPTRWGNPSPLNGTPGQPRRRHGAAYRDLIAADPDPAGRRPPHCSPAATSRAGARSDQPCHADVLLTIANPARRTRMSRPGGSRSPTCPTGRCQPGPPPAPRSWPPPAWPRSCSPARTGPAGSAGPRTPAGDRADRRRSRDRDRCFGVGHVAGVRGRAGMSGPARVAVFGFVELAVAVSAIRARRALRETGSTGVDGAAVWVLAGLSAALSALDAAPAPRCCCGSPPRWSPRGCGTRPRTGPPAAAGPAPARTGGVAGHPRAGAGLAAAGRAGRARGRRGRPGPQGRPADHADVPGFSHPRDHTSHPPGDEPAAQ